MEIIRLADQDAYVAPDNAVAREIASPRNSRATKQSIAEIVIKPGVTVDEHYHKEIEKIYYIAAGEGIMTLDGEEARMVPGESVVILPGQWHTIRNEGADNLVMIVTCVPAWYPEDSVFRKDVG